MKKSDLIIIGVVLLGAIGIGYFVLKNQREKQDEIKDVKDILEKQIQENFSSAQKSLENKDSVESLLTLIPKKCLPVKYGGTGRPGTKDCIQYEHLINLLP